MTTPMAPPAVDATAASGQAVWLPPGAASVTVAGYPIAGGLFYLGSGLTGAYAAGVEPALVDPAAPVRRVRLDQETPAESERPSYAGLTPGARAAYLEWLAGGRTGPTPAAHLWLFLYGLERRVLVDLAGTLGGHLEYTAIAAEISALRQGYPHVTGFEAQAADFADLLDALIELTDPALQPPSIGPRTGDLPLRLRVGIGRYVAGGAPIALGWAYAWHAYSPLRQWGPSVTRRPDDFRRAFAARYAEAYPAGGLIVPAPAELLVLHYRPASPSFADRAMSVHTGLPDVRGLVGPLHALAAVATRAEADLSATDPSAPPPAGPLAPAAPASASPAAASPAAPEPAAQAAAPPEPASPRPASAGPEPTDPPRPPGEGRAEQTAPPRTQTPAEPDGSRAPARPGPAGGQQPPEPRSPGTAPGARESAEREAAERRPPRVAEPPRPAAAPGSAERPRPRPRPTDARPSEPPPTRVAVGPHLAAADALLRLVTVAGIADGHVRAVRRRVVDALGITATERHALDDRLDDFAHRRPDAAVVTRRFAGLPRKQQDGVADLLIATAGAEGVVEPAHAAVLAVVFNLLGLGATELRERLDVLEVAAVVDDSDMDVTVLDEEFVARTLAGSAGPIAVIHALVAPVSPRYAGRT